MTLERSNTVIEASSIDSKPIVDFYQAYGTDGNTNSRAMRQNKKSESTEGTPASNMPGVASKINTSLRNKHAFDKYHPGSLEEKAPNKPAQSNTGNQNKLGQYKQAAANQKRLLSSGKKQ